LITKLPGNEIGDNSLVKFAKDLAMDNGQRCFLRKDGMIAFNLREVRHWLQLQIRNGTNPQFEKDLTDIDAQIEKLKKIEQEFNAEANVHEKRAILKKYKAFEAELIALISKGDA